ncbi:hypothetical protein Q1695_014299 [Nippostrongylus brasiliensis]|nr:hypothetical protein Q1695_014299 [Nippostrongylus brasiliensis]
MFVLAEKSCRLITADFKNGSSSGSSNAMALDLGGNKKKQNDKSKYSIVELSLFKPGKKKYSEFDYEEIRKKQLKEDDSSGDDERFHDREALEIVKRLEAKYGGKKNKKGRKLCFGTEDDYMDKRAGYDLEDDFIDDSEAYDELIPSTMDTVQGGFYVNRGKLEFKSRHEEVNDSDISDVEETTVLPKKGGTKRPQISNDDEAEVVDDDPAPAPTTSKNVNKTAAEPPAPAPVVSKPRMVGAPPTKVRRMALGESPNQRAANAIKKRLVGMPPTILKRKVLQNAVARKENEMSDFLRNMAGGEIPPVDKDIVEVLSSTAVQPSTATKSPEKSAEVSTSAAATTAPGSSQNVSPSTSATPSSSAGAVPTSPQKKKPLAPMTDTLSSMIEEFKRVTNNLALPGQKKRLQNLHVDMVIAIEEQCLKDGYSVHEKARVAHSLADFCGIQKNSLYARCIKRRDEHKNGAPNLAFLAKSFPNPSSSPAKTGTAATTTSTISKATTATTSGTALSKSTSLPAPTAAVPSIAKTTSLPSTSGVDVPEPSVPRTSVPSTAPSTSVTSAGPSQVTTSSSGSSSSKANQSWTTQKKLAAQAVITNVAALPAFSTRVGELQDILKKIASESITYEDFLKWHEMSTKPSPPKAPSEQKPNQNGIARQSSTASTSSKVSAHGNETNNESSSATQARSSPSLLVPVKKVTLAQAMASSKLPPPSRPVAMNSSQMTEKFESEKQTTIRAVTTAIENSKVAHKKKCEAAAAAGKPPPRFDFLWTENLSRSLRNQLELYWSVLLTPETHSKAVEGIVTIFAKEIYPYFKGEIKLSRLFVEYARRSPDKAFILATPSVQRLLKDDGVDLNNVTVVTRKEKTGNESAVSKTGACQDEGDVVCVEPSTSSAASTSNGDTSSGGTTSSSSSSASKQAMSAINGMGMNMTPTQVAELSSAMQHLTTLTTDPQKLMVLQQALLMQVMTHNQVEAKRKQDEEKRKEDEKKRKLAEEEREAKRKQKEEEKLKLKKAAAEKVLEEKRLRQEEEKKQKLAEKARKAEEERERRLQEQAEKERAMREERERQAKEAAEKLKKEEEERKRLEEIRIKVEEEKARELEEKRQAQLREEEEKAALELEKEILLEEDPHLEVPAEMKLVLEEEEEAESLRLKKQEEQVAAVRAANLAAQAHATPIASKSSTPTTFHESSPKEQKPLAPIPSCAVATSTPKSQPSTPLAFQMHQHSNVICSPGSQGSGGAISMSPQCILPMTPPSHRSPAFHQQQVVQSPQQHQPVQSPLSTGQHHQTASQRSQVQPLSCSQPLIQQPRSSVSFDQPLQSFAQPHSQSTSPLNAFGFGQRPQQHHQQIHLPVAQQPPARMDMQQSYSQYSSQRMPSPAVDQSHMALQQQRIRDMYMMQHQHQNLAQHRQQDQIQQQPAVSMQQSQASFSMEQPLQRPFSLQHQQPQPQQQQRQVFQQDSRHHQMQQQQQHEHMMNQFSHHQQNHNPFGF